MMAMKMMTAVVDCNGDDDLVVDNDDAKVKRGLWPK